MKLWIAYYPHGSWDWKRGQTYTIDEHRGHFPADACPEKLLLLLMEYGMDAPGWSLEEIRTHAEWVEEFGEAFDGAQIYLEGDLCARFALDEDITWMTCKEEEEEEEDDD